MQIEAMLSNPFIVRHFDNLLNYLSSTGRVLPLICRYAENTRMKLHSLGQVCLTVCLVQWRPAFPEYSCVATFSYLHVFQSASFCYSHRYLHVDKRAGMSHFRQTKAAAASKSRLLLCGLSNMLSFSRSWRS